MILQIRKYNNFDYKVVAHWTDINKILLMSNIDKEKLEESIKNNSSYNDDFFILLK